MTDVVRTPDFEDLAMRWMIDQVRRLRNALASNGVADADTQRETCTDYFFSMAIDFDDAEIPPPDLPRRRLAFESDNRLVLPDDDSYAMHEAVMGIVDFAFDGE